MEKKVLVLGAGMVAPPMVRFLLELPNIRVTVADVERNKADALVARSPQGIGLALDFENTKRVKQEIEGAELVISLLPFPYHPRVAELCVQTRTDLITASYTSQEMRSMREEIERAGILVLNEIGLDPGIDHMEAMRVIHAVEARGGRIRSFVSFCGGLPAPEANTNPLGYKFSWSPQSVLAASTSPARYLEDGEEVPVSPGDLFKDPLPCSLTGIGRLEGYPNRDSLPYMETYSIPETTTIFRGTLRNIGWCPTWKKITELGILDLNER
ncbi:MAG: saccharopine dehydrogenase C-terminal domain-containing protein, partial [Candidatus Aminicenantaceae bacterium]